MLENHARLPRVSIIFHLLSLSAFGGEPGCSRNFFRQRHQRRQPPSRALMLQPPGRLAAHHSVLTSGARQEAHAPVDVVGEAI